MEFRPGLKSSAYGRVHFAYGFPYLMARDVSKEYSIQGLSIYYVSKNEKLRAPRPILPLLAKPLVSLPYSRNRRNNICQSLMVYCYFDIIGLIGFRYRF